MATIKIANVRLSYPSVFQTEMYKGEDTGKFACTAILKKPEETVDEDGNTVVIKNHDAAIKAIKAAIKKIIKTDLRGKTPSDEKICLKDGDDTDKPELQGAYSVKATSEKRPKVLDRDKTPLVQSDGVIYGGCMVNIILHIFASKKYGRVSAGLDGIQFAGHGEPFGAAPIEDDEFDVFGEADDDDDVVNY
jgi:hypothetical protein